MRFTAVQDFFSDETQSQYATGMSYAATDDRLRELVAGWIAEGKVVEGGSEATVTGKE